MARVVIPGFRKIETSGGGEGGTTNYNDLTNKPSINNVSLVGNLNTVDLKLTDATLTEEGVPAEAKTVGTKLEEQSSNLTSEISRAKETEETLKSRIDTITSLPEGSTTGDAELQDIRVKADGTTATSAGNAVREQFNELKGDLVNVVDFSYIPPEKTTFIENAKKNYWKTLSSFRKDNYFPYINTWNQNDTMLSKICDIEENTEYITNVETYFDFYNNNDEYISGGSVEANETFITPPGTTKARIGIRKTSVPDRDVEIYKVGDCDVKPYFNLNYSKETENKRILSCFNADDRNKIDYSKVIDNYYVNYGTGEENYNVEYGASDYIDVSNTDYITVKNIGQFAYYDANKVYIPYNDYPCGQMATNTYQNSYYQFKVPSVAKYVKFSLRKSIGLSAEVYTGKMENLLLNLYEFNYFNDSNKENYRIKPNGEEWYYVGYALTDYIYIGNSDYVTMRGFEQFVYYDDNKTYISGVDDISKVMKEYKIPHGAKYIRLSIPENSYRVLPELYNMSLADYAFITTYRKRNYTVGKDGKCDYTNFSQAMMDFLHRTNCKLFVKDGLYDVAQELGNYYLSNYKDSDIHGFQLGGNNEYLFSPNSKIQFNYNGSNDYVKLSFTPFSSSFRTVPSYIIDGATIEVTNCRYCLHDDVNYARNFIHYIKNCTMINHGNDAHDFNQCIGGGLGFSGISEIESCILKSEKGNKGVSYHGSAGGSTTAKCKTVIKDCYISGNKTIDISAYGNSTLVSEYVISNNSVGAPINVQESDIIDAKIFNNEVRSN